MKSETIEGGGAESAAPVRTKGIAILGSHPQTKLKAPFDDPDWLIWGCSPDNSPHGNPANCSVLPRVDEHYEIHLPIADKSRPYAYLRWLEQQPVVWMRDMAAMPQFPGAKEYPDAGMRRLFGPFHFTSSIAFMLAHAIHRAPELGVGKIGLWGIMQASPNEYAYQRPGIQYFLWQAHKAKLDILVPPESRLLEPPPEDF